MIKKAGVYTAKCPGCGQSVLVHLASDGSISPDKCKECSLEFECVEYGEQRNTFDIVVKEEKLFFIANKETKNKETKNKETKEETKKTAKKTGKKTGKKTAKNHFNW